MLDLVGLCSSAYLCIEYCDLPLFTHEMFRMNPSLQDSKLLKSDQSSTDVHHPILILLTVLCLETS